MTKKMQTQRVHFRKWIKKHGGGVIAILPDVPANPGFVMMYEHIGQHGEGSYSIYSATSPAAPYQYNSLLKELRSIGYKLRVVNRITRNALIL